LKKLQSEYQSCLDLIAQLTEEKNQFSLSLDPPKKTTSRDSFSRVQAELQGANFEKNRLKETIYADE